MEEGQRARVHRVFVEIATDGRSEVGARLGLLAGEDFFSPMRRMVDVLRIICQLVQRQCAQRRLRVGADVLCVAEGGVPKGIVLHGAVIQPAGEYLVVRKVGISLGVGPL